MKSVPRRLRLSSHPCMMCLRERPTSLGPSPMGKRTFVARTTSSRTPSSARPVISSETPFEYTSAVSIKLPPASRKRPTISLEVSSSASCPKVMHPRHSSETINPVLPRRPYSMRRSSQASSVERPYSSTGDAFGGLVTCGTNLVGWVGWSSGGSKVQSSDAGKLRDPRVPRIPPVVALIFWAAGALVFAFLPQNSEWKPLIATIFSLSAATFAAAILLRATPRAQGHERSFLQLMGAGMIFRLAGNASWSATQLFGFQVAAPVAPQDIAYAISYPLLVGAMLHLVALTTRGITLVSALDAGAVMLSVGTLTWYFVLGPAAAGLGSVREAVATLSQPVCDAGLLFLGLVVASSLIRPRFSTLLNGGFVALVLTDAAYLRLRSVGPYQSGNWPELLWALGMNLLGLTSATSPEVPADPNVRRIQPWQ